MVLVMALVLLGLRRESEVTRDSDDRSIKDRGLTESRTLWCRFHVVAVMIGWIWQWCRWCSCWGTGKDSCMATVSLQPVSPTNSGVWPSWPLAYPGYQSGVISCSFVPPQEKSMQQEHVQLAMCLTCKTQDLSSITNVLKSRAWGQELVLLSTGNWNNSKSQLKTKP